VGTVVAADPPNYRVKVTQTLAGQVGPEVSFPKWRDGSIPVGTTRIFFLVSGKNGLVLFYPFAHEDPNRADDVRRLVDMKAEPKKYFDDPKHAGTPEFLEMLGLVFETRDRVGKLAKKDAVEHLRWSLTSRDMMAVLHAVAGLQLTGSKEAAVSVIPLLRSPDQSSRHAAARFLGWAGDRRAVEPLCKALDAVNDNRELEASLCWALLCLQDPASAPAIRWAVKGGQDGWACIALGRVGTEADFELLLGVVMTGRCSDATGGMLSLVRRSNKPVAPWMGTGSWSRQTGETTLPDWRKWWDANKADFRVIKTAEEAFKLEEK
jgi:hypothetical protein